MPRPQHELATGLERARALTESGQILQAEMLYLALLKAWPDCAEAAFRIGGFAMNRGDATRAVQFLRRAFDASPDVPQIGVDLGLACLADGQPELARQALERTVARSPQYPAAWLHLGEVRELLGDAVGAANARFRALTRAQQLGQWVSQSTTPPELLKPVLDGVARHRSGRRQILFACLDALRQEFGRDDMKRVELALTGYLGEPEITPPDPRQRPKFFYFPGLPEGPYHDPMLQPWAPVLRDAWRDIRDEARALLAEDRDFESFLGLKPGQKADAYVGGTNPAAAWDAYFFYRRGQRFDEHHSRCPKTSSVLDSIELCRVGSQAPEVCFSVIRPQTTIVAHHGVTNTRLVMHLPLIVPPDCALNIIDAGAHHWKEGELMMFDDTFQHEAWNRSEQPRLIVLMDCWNPHLTGPEQQAVKRLVETIDALEN